MAKTNCSLFALRGILKDERGNTKTINNMDKTFYEKPLADVFEIEMEGTLLDGSVEAMNAITGSWEEDE